MNPPAETRAEGNGAASSAPPCGTAFGCPRAFLDNRFVDTVISPRAHGLSVGVNMNPDKRCNFDCVYCEVNRHEPSQYTQSKLQRLSGFMFTPAESPRARGEMTV